MVTCPDQTRLSETFEEANRAWLACQAGSDEAALNEALASRNAAANRLYEHRSSCAVCKSSYIKERRAQDRP
jgi:hypothetical protein